MNLEPLRELIERWRKESDDFERDGDEDSASAYYNCAERLSDLIAEIGQEVGAVACGKCGVRQPLRHSPDCGRSSGVASAAAFAKPGDIDCLGFEDGHTYPGIRRHADESHTLPLYTSPAHTSDARDADINDLALEQGPDDIPRLTLAGRELAAFPAGTIDKVMDTLSILGGHCVGDSDRLDFMNMHRVALVPEFEGPWDVEVYDEGQMVSVFSGNDTRSALDAAIAAMRQEGDTP